MSLAFGSPWMLWGAALVALPILIHLLNRRRYVVVPFAAMSFLLAAFKSRRRRLRMENLLLLLLRCLLVLLAALAMALPFVPEDSPLAALSGGRRELVLIVDRSGSMGRLVAPGVTADDRVLESLRRRLGALSEERGDAVTLICMGAGNPLPAPIGATPAMALAALDGLPPPSGVADVLAAARLLADRVRPARPGRLDVVVLSDLQRLSWADVGPSLGATFAKAFEQGGGTLRIEPAGAGGRAPLNVGVQSLAALDPLPRAGEPLAFSAELRNWSETEPAQVDVHFEVDGVRADTQHVALPPLGTATVESRQRLDAPGAHHVTASLPPDDLPLDDSRTLALRAHERPRVLLIDGAPGGADPLSWSTGYLSLALDPQQPGTSPRFEPLSWEVGRLDGTTAQLAGFDAIVLSDVGALTEEQAGALASTVQSGTPLLIFLGPAVEPALWAARLQPRGLLPMAVGDVRGDPSGATGEDYVTLALPEPPPPALALFADPRLAVLLQVPIFAWRDLQPLPAVPGAEAAPPQVLASFADALGHTVPALVEGRLSRGRVLLCATSCGVDWSLLPRNPALWVPLAHELLTALLADDPSERNVPVGQQPALLVDGWPQSGQLTFPSGAVVPVDRPTGEHVGERMRLDAPVPLDEAGPYKLELALADGTQTTLALAAQPDAREGDLRAVDDAVLGQALTGVEWTLGAELQEEGAPRTAGGDGSLAQALLWALLACALAESLFARWLGTPREARA
ncbi:MAG TPA: BatA domain-containing protein [Planctomycetota bacterium]|nr:BatA domain-containing protein [Planctomycetota bacterium]